MQPWTGGGGPGGAKRERNKEEMHNLRHQGKRRAAPAEDKAQQMPVYEPGKKKAEGGFTLVGFQWGSGAP